MFQIPSHEMQIETDFIILSSVKWVKGLLGLHNMFNSEIDNFICTILISNFHL